MESFIPISAFAQERGSRLGREALQVADQGFHQATPPPSGEGPPWEARSHSARSSCTSSAFQDKDQRHDPKAHIAQPDGDPDHDLP